MRTHARFASAGSSRGGVRRALTAGAAAASCALAVGLFGCAGTGHAATAGAQALRVTSGPASGSVEVGETRHRNHGGALRLIAVSVDELDLTSDQRATLEALRDDLIAKMVPGREAGKELANVLADEVATGTVDRARADALVARVGEASVALHQATLGDLNRLHAVLTPAQRSTLMSKMRALWSEWSRESPEWATAEHTPPRDVAVLAERLGLSQEQLARVQDRFESSMKGVVRDYYPMNVQPRMQAFTSAFEADAFDARTLPTQPTWGAPPGTFGAMRMARFFEAFAPELTPEQRAALAQDLRDHAARHDQP